MPKRAKSATPTTTTRIATMTSTIASEISQAMAARPGGHLVELAYTEDLDDEPQMPARPPVTGTQPSR
jgi:hypothetical protein